MAGRGGQHGFMLVVHPIVLKQREYIKELAMMVEGLLRIGLGNQQITQAEFEALWMQYLLEKKWARPVVENVP